MAIKITHNQKDFFIGDTVRLDYKIKEGGKERTQAFDGIIIAIKGTVDNRTFTVKKEASDKIIVERIFPVNSPWIVAMKKLRSPKKKIRRAKLYFLRNPKARKI